MLVKFIAVDNEKLIDDNYAYIDDYTIFERALK